MQDFVHQPYDLTEELAGCHTILGFRFFFLSVTGLSPQAATNPPCWAQQGLGFRVGDMGFAEQHRALEYAI